MSNKPKPDLTEFESLARRVPTRCLIGRHLDALGETDRLNLTAALEAEHIPHRIISRWLKDRGLQAADKTVCEHRRGDCCCV